MYMGETRGPTGALVHLLCDRRLKTPGNGAAKESNLPSVGLPRLTGFEGRLGHRPRPLHAGRLGLGPRPALAGAKAAGQCLPGGGELGAARRVAARGAVDTVRV